MISSGLLYIFAMKLRAMKECCIVKITVLLFHLLYIQDYSMFLAAFWIYVKYFYLVHCLESGA